MSVLDFVGLSLVLNHLGLGAHSQWGFFELALPLQPCPSGPTPSGPAPAMVECSPALRLSKVVQPHGTPYSFPPSALGPALSPDRSERVRI